MEYEPIIGLEIHVQLKTKSKMFCSSPNHPDAAEPNTNICEVCTGQPGVLPQANKEAIRKAVMVGLALGCQIPKYSKFDRKNYFYPDLPKGYQISQYDQPLCKQGWVEIKAHDLSPNPSPSPGEGSVGISLPKRWGGIKGEVGSRKIRITRVHLEEDAGKLLHEGEITLVDFNRAGVPLLEIVTEPDFRSPQEAKLFLQNLRNIMRYLGVSDADMEKGHLRCDANVSLRKSGVNELPPYKAEVKNLNSFKAVEAALAYEIERQIKVLEGGEVSKNETRGWDEVKQITTAQRVKEEAQDYRYFPEPDLPIMHFTKKYIEELRASLPELPAQKLQRFIAEFGLLEQDAQVLINDKDLAGYFEEVVSELQEWMKTPSLSLSHEGRGMSQASSSLRPGGGGGRMEEERREDIKKFAKLACNWITGDFQALLKTAEISPQASRITAENLAELIKMIDKNEISVTAGKKVLQIMFEKGGDPSNIVADEGLAQVSDETAIEQAIDKIIMENQKAVEDFRAGKQQSLGFLVGQVMKELKGKGNPQVINEILKKKLS